MEPTEEGDYVIFEGEAPHEIRKVRGSEIPFGKVGRLFYLIEKGGRVPVIPLFTLSGTLIETLVVGGKVFVRGQHRSMIEKALGLYIEPKLIKCPKCGGSGEIYDKEY